MTIFPSFRSTVTPFVPRAWPATLRLLVDPVTGAPAGIESPNANGPNGIWTPVDLTAGQIASPSTAMIADLNATYRLNVAPYTRYQSDGTTLQAVTAGGVFLPLAGGTITGTLGQTITTAWSGITYPGTNNAALYSTQTYTGTPSAGFSDSFGTEIPLNLSYISSDQLNWNPGGPGAVFGWEFKHQFGGGSANGARATLSVDTSLTGTIGASNKNFTAFQAAMGATANVTGATTGAGGLGDFFTFAGYYGRMGSGVFAHGAAAMELDYAPTAGSTINYVDGIKIVNYGPLTYHATTHESVLSISTANPGTTGTWNHIITFGDPQAPGGGFPASTTGDLITAYTGTVANVMDFSAVTATGNLLIGQSGLTLTGSGNINCGGFNYVSLLGATTTNAPTIESLGLDATVGLNFKVATGTTGKFIFLNGNNNQQFEIDSVASAVSRAVFSGAASGSSVPLDVAGTATGITIGATAATGLFLGRSGITTQILGTIKGAAGSFTANGAIATALSSVGPAGAQTTVQEWFTVTNASGAVRYIPAF